MNCNNTVARAVRYALMMGAAAGASTASLPAQAQETAQQAEEPSTVVVTGTRIRRVDTETADPVFVINSDAIEQSGVSSMGELVQRIPGIAGAAVNPAVNNGGGFGESNIDLRGLGGFGPSVEPRTLILLDGRRVGLIGASGAVDVNLIPMAAIERVEVLKEGAGAVYGSDAVAGVVNFITKKDYVGSQLNAEFAETGQSDGERRGASFTVGGNSDQLSFMLTGSYTKQDGVSAADRDFSKNSLGLYTGSVIIGGSSRTQFGRISLDTAGTAGLRAQFGCSSVVRKDGTTGTTLGDYRCRSVATHPEDNFNFQPDNLILTPQERGAIFTKLNYHFTDNVDGYASLLYNRTHSGFQIAALPFDTQQDDVVISKNSIYNPFGVDFGGLTTGNSNATTRTVALGDRSSVTTTDSKLLSAGVKGTIPSTNWDWDLGFEYGRLDQEASISGYLFLPLAKQAFGPSMLVNGTPTCVAVAGDASTTISGCTPVNFFAINTASAAATLSSLTAGYSTFNTYRTRSATFDVTGKIADLPGGALQLAVGLDYRKQDGQITRSFDAVGQPPLFLSCQLSGETCGSETIGGYSQKEIYAEIFVPILQDVPGAKALNVTGGIRYSDYSNFGGTTRSQFKLEYRPVSDLLVRGTFAQIFRAPTVNDLFAGPATNAATFTDPCNGLTAAAVAANANLAKLCQFVPTDGSFAEANSQSTGLPSGNPNLSPETGNVLTWGAVYDSSVVRNLSLSVDVWRYKINNVISLIDPNFAATQCSSTGQDEFCGLFNRQPSTGQILFINQPTFNLGTLKTDGVDLGARYALKDTRAGSFSFTIDATRVNSYENAPAPGAQTEEIVGTYNRQFGNFARWRGILGLGWSMGGFDGLLAARYIHKIELPNADGGDPTEPGFISAPLQIPSFTYLDLTMGYNFATKTKVQLGVINVTDKQPPLMFSNNVINANTDVQTYDVLGRRFFLTVVQKF
jgi:iron complex outermembrane receptor protein